MPGQNLVWGRAQVPKGPKMDVPGVTCLHEAQPVPKTSPVLSKGAPIRTIPKVCTFRPHKFSHHCQVPDLMGQKILFS